MSTCPDCRYCEPASSSSPRQGWPHPARWFDQPCPQCAHRLKAHDPGVPRVGSHVPILAADGEGQPVP